MSKEAQKGHGPKLGSRGCWLRFVSFTGFGLLLATMGPPTLEAIQIYNGWKSAPTTDLDTKIPGSKNTLEQPGAINFTVLESPCAVKDGPNTILAQSVRSPTADRFCAVLPSIQTKGTLYEIALNGNVLRSAQMPTCKAAQTYNCFQDKTIILDNSLSNRGAGWSNRK